MGPKTARLTVLLEPSRKQEFEQACHDVDMTPSQVVRRLIRDWLDSGQGARPHPALPIPARVARKRA